MPACGKMAKKIVSNRQRKAAMSDANNTTSMNFEAALKELEQIVRELESGDVGLDDSLKKFEQGIELYKRCRQTLEGAEKRIKILSDSLKEIDYQE
jgi:exodeoxyribonuclease VII small subunit